MDTLTKEKRSWNMSKIKGKDTKPELIVRSLLHRNGYRFRLHRDDLPGSPDIVLPKYSVVIFVHGCFWHRHKGCKFSYTPKSRRKFWKSKFDQNMKRDVLNMKMLKKTGWTVYVIWECETNNTNKLSRKIESLLN